MWIVFNSLMIVFVNFSRHIKIMMKKWAQLKLSVLSVLSFVWVIVSKRMHMCTYITLPKFEFNFNLVIKRGCSENVK